MRKAKPQAGEIWTVHSLTTVYETWPPHRNCLDKSKEIWARSVNGEWPVTVMIIRREGLEDENTYLVLFDDVACIIKESNLIECLY